MTDRAIMESREKNGPNVLPAPKQKPLLLQYFEQMANLFSFVLLVCGAISIAVYIIQPTYWINLYTGLIFWGVAFFNAALEFWQAYSSAKTLEGFLSLVPANTLAIRNGSLEEIAANEVVVGDLMMLRSGNKVPADGRVLWSENLRIDNSSLTGESEPQERNAEPTQDDLMEAKNMIYSGTIVVSGDVIALVVRVGPHTVIGRLAAFAVTAPKRVSRLEQEMTVLFRRLVACALVFGVLAIILGFSMGSDVQDVLNTATGVFISFLPQGLPATMTILLTTAAKRMASRNVLVKELRSVETLGAMTLLATDKTGTLTQNKMAVVGGWIYGKIYNGVEEIDAAIGNLDDFIQSVSLCTACKFDPKDRDKAIGDRVIFGDATEVGILQYTGQFLDIEDEFEKNRRVFEIPFSSATKWHLTIYQLEGQDHYTAFMKGAPERVLSHCKTFRQGNETFPVNDDLREDFQRKYEYFASKGLRILAVARKKLSSEDYPSDFLFTGNAEKTNAPTTDFEFLGFICLRDPPKPGVSWAVERLKSARIRIVMVTGDHPFTAEAIARQVGIITETEAFKRPPTASDMQSRPNVRAAIIKGDEIETMSAGDWKRIASLDEIIFARTAPRHKLEIVKQFQAAGHIVGVSGDGVNDSPALRKANLGISMNRTASDVSKDAAHMILLDDNFVSIVAGVFEGRLIYENVKKSIRYTLTHITAEVSGLLIYVLLLIPPPLSPILLIFIDVFAELGPAVSFAGEPPEYDLMTLPPRQKVRTVVPADRRIYQWLSSLNLPERFSTWITYLVRPFYLQSKGEALVDWDLVSWSFFQGGVIVAAGAWGAYVLALVANDVPLGSIYRSDLTYWVKTSPPFTLSTGALADGTQQFYILGSVQAAYYLAILIVQWFNVFMQKHRWRLPYGIDMFTNWMTYVGIASAMLVASIVCFIPVLNNIFDTQVPPALALAAPFAAGAFLVIYEFIRRSLRAQGLFGGIPDRQVMQKPKNVKAIEVPPIPRSRELSIIDRPSI